MTRIEPLRDMVVLTLRPERQNGGRIQVVTNTRPAVREAEVVGIGPEVRDIHIGEIVLINLLVASEVGEFYVVAEPHILGTL